MLKSFDPATGDLVGEVAITPVSEIPGIVARARTCQAAWEELGLHGRLAALRRAGPRLREHVDDLAALATAEMGKPLAEARGEARAVAVDLEEELEGIAAALASESRLSERVHTTIYRDPFGVAVCISPWNFPILMPHQEVLPALMAGNTVVFKPSEKTPLTGHRYAELLQGVLPPGVLQIVHGDEVQGKALVADDVDLIVFTGSRNAGRHILAEASRQLKRVILELGGKDPLVVLDDADVPRAATFAARNSFRNAGQVCVSTERIYVEDGAWDAFLQAFIAASAAMQVGPGTDPSSRVGPMVDAAQRDHVVRQIRAAVSSGATVAWSGAAGEGNFLAPTILTDVTHDMEIATEETFGPVACVMRVHSDEDAVRLANDSPFGLGAVVFGSTARARRVARRLQAGMIGVNQGIHTAGDTPWVGARQSGYGFHSGPEGHRQFAQVRVISEPAS